MIISSLLWTFFTSRTHIQVRLILRSDLYMVFFYFILHFFASRTLNQVRLILWKTRFSKELLYHLRNPKPLFFFFFKANVPGRISQRRPAFIHLEPNEKPLSRHWIRRTAALLVPLSLLPPPASLTTSGHPGAQTAWTDQNPEYMPSASSFWLMMLPTEINSLRTITFLRDNPLPQKHAQTLAPDSLCVMEKNGKMALAEWFYSLFVTIMQLGGWVAAGPSVNV